MSMQTRRRIAEEVMARMRDRGFPIEEERDFTQLIGRWVDGEIPMSDCHRHYLAVLRQRSERPQAPAAPAPQIDLGGMTEPERNWDM
jgi:hypothetical protein